MPKICCGIDTLVRKKQHIERITGIPQLSSQPKQNNHKTNHLIETDNRCIQSCLVVSEIAEDMTNFINILVILTNFSYSPIGHLDQLYKYNKMKKFHKR